MNHHNASCASAFSVAGRGYPGVVNAAAVLTALAVAFAPVPAVAPEPSGLLATVAAPPVDPLDAALDGDRSILSFLPGDVRGGRFTIPVEGRHHGTKPAQSKSGVFWRTGSGNVYTRSEPYDEELVRSEVRSLLDHFAREREETDARLRAEGRDPVRERERTRAHVERVLPLSKGTFYGGSEYQWPVWPVFAALLVPDLDNSVLSEDPPCWAAVDAFLAGVRREVNALRPDFRPAGARDRWAVELAPLHAAMADESSAAVRACGLDEGGFRSSERDAAAVVFERWRTGVSVRVRAADGEESDGDAIRVTPGDPGPPPAAADPAPFDPVLNEFVLAVAACRALPWEYSNFAAANSYYPPFSWPYNGPSAISSGSEWVCEADVPASERAAAVRFEWKGG